MSNVGDNTGGGVPPGGNGANTPPGGDGTGANTPPGGQGTGVPPGGDGTGTPPAGEGTGGTGTGGAGTGGAGAGTGGAGAGTGAGTGGAGTGGAGTGAADTTGTGGADATGTGGGAADTTSGGTPPSAPAPAPKAAPTDATKTAATGANPETLHTSKGTSPFSAFSRNAASGLASRLSARAPTVLSLLKFKNPQDAIDCFHGHGVVTHRPTSDDPGLGANAIWISCKTWLARGTLERNPWGVPIGIDVPVQNRKALEGPQATSPQYGKFSAGDYVNGELWVAVEDETFSQPAGIARYNAKSLEFIDFSVHPTITSMPWITYLPTANLVVTANATNNGGQLEVMNAETREWTDDKPLLLHNLPEAYKDDVPYIVGAAADENVHKLYFQMNDDASTILTFQLTYHEGLLAKEPVTVHYESAWATELAPARGGLAVSNDHLLSLGNHAGQTTVMAIQRFPLTREEALAGVGFGVLIGWMILLLLWCICWPVRACCRLRERRRAARYSAGVTEDPYSDDQPITENGHGFENGDKESHENGEMA